MNEEEKQILWSTRNKIVEKCHQTIRNLAQQYYFETVECIKEIEKIIETVYRENAS